MQNRFPHPHVRLAFVHDVIMAMIAFPLAFILRLGKDFLKVTISEDMFLISWLIFVLVAAVTIYKSDMHRGFWRYATIRDLRMILQAASLITLVFIMASFMIERLESLPRSLPFLLWALLIILWCGPRIFYRLWRDGYFVFRNWRKNNIVQGKTPILIYGDINELEPYLRHQQKQSNNPYKVVGIITTSAKLSGRELHGVPLLGDVNKVESLLKSNSLRIQPVRIVIAMKSGQGANDDLRILGEMADRLAIPLSRLPGFDEIKEGVEDNILRSHSIPLEDLLGRPQRPLDMQLISNLINNQTVMVTGAGGSIGSELVRQICRFAPKEVILLENSEYALYLIDLELTEKFPQIKTQSILADVRNFDSIDRIFSKNKPDLVFHAAAYKHVPLVETNPIAGLITNVLGTKNIANASIKHHVKLIVQISTDKAVKPTNIMGAAKRIAEILLQIKDNQRASNLKEGNLESKDSPNTRFAVVRFGNVLGSTGSVIPLFERQIRRGGPLTVTHKDITRYFMTIQEAVQLVLSAGALGLKDEKKVGGIFILDMGEPVRIDDLAKRMIRLAGFRPDEEIEVIYTGLRKGEKLYEELHHDDEKHIPTSIKGITIVNPVSSKEQFEFAMAKLETCLIEGNETEAIEWVKQLVLDYKPIS